MTCYFVLKHMMKRVLFVGLIMLAVGLSSCRKREEQPKSISYDELTEYPKSVIDYIYENIDLWEYEGGSDDTLFGISAHHVLFTDYEGKPCFCVTYIISESSQFTTIKRAYYDYNREPFTMIAEEEYLKQSVPDSGYNAASAEPTWSIRWSEDRKKDFLANAYYK